MGTDAHPETRAVAITMAANLFCIPVFPFLAVDKTLFDVWHAMRRTPNASYPEPTGVCVSNKMIGDAGAQ
jgi:hypothetical protein